jgi:hypothetical protein
MTYEGVKLLHEGRRLGAIGDIFELLEKKLELDFHVCPNCKKVEFFVHSDPESFKS